MMNIILRVWIVTMRNVLILRNNQQYYRHAAGARILLDDISRRKQPHVSFTVQDGIKSRCPLGNQTTQALIQKWDKKAVKYLILA